MVAKLDYQVDYRDIKHPRLEFKTGSLLLVLPIGYAEKDALLEKHRSWIEDKEQIIKNALAAATKSKLEYSKSESDLRRITQSAISAYVQAYDFDIGQVRFRRMKTKWGSYSRRGNLTLNYHLKYLPDDLIRYVVFHELSHSIERKHNQEYWRLIRKEFPNHGNLERDLLVYWFLLQNINR